MSREAKYTPTMKQEASGESLRFHSITAMPEYENCSFEEIRLRDYSQMKTSAAEQTTRMSKDRPNSLSVFPLKNTSSIPVSVTSSMYHPTTTRTKVTNFYKIFNPVKVKDVDKILKKYSGNEGVLFDRLAMKYNQNVSIFDYLIREIYVVPTSGVGKSPALAGTATSTSTPFHFNSPSTASNPFAGKNEKKKTPEVQPAARAASTTADLCKVGSDTATPRMMDTSVGRAYMLVDMILEYIKSVSQTNHFLHAIKLKAVAKDPMFDMAKKLIERQEEFFLQGHCTHVDLAFHYTTEEYLKDIQRFGLLSHEERMKKSSKLTHKNGQVFGNGIYTANNAFAFQKFGPAGLVVARLKGSCSQRVKKISQIQDGHSYTSIVGNKISGIDPIGYYDEIVLLESSQVIPLVRFETEAINFKHQSGSLSVEHRLEALYEVMKGLGRVVDDICNNDKNQAKLGSDTEFVSLNEFKAFYASVKTQMAGNAQNNRTNWLQQKAQLQISTAQSKVLPQAKSINVMNTIFPPMLSSTSGPSARPLKASSLSPAPKTTAAPYPPMSKAAPKPFPGVNKSSVAAAAPTFKSTVDIFPPLSGTDAASKNSSVSATQKFPPSVGKVEQPKKSDQSTQAPGSPDPPGAIGIGGVSIQTTSLGLTFQPRNTISSGWTFQPKNATSNIGGRGSLQASKAPTNTSLCGTAPSNDSNNSRNMTSHTNASANCNISSSWGANTVTFSSSSKTGFNGVIGTGEGFSIGTSTVARERKSSVSRRIVRSKRPR